MDSSGGPPSFVTVCVACAKQELPVHHKDLCASRWDVVLRCIVASLMLSGATRRNCEVRFLLSRMGKILAVNGNNVRWLRCDERNNGHALAYTLSGATEQKCCKGWSCVDGDEGALVPEDAQVLLWLCEDGQQLTWSELHDLTAGKRVVLLLGDHQTDLNATQVESMVRGKHVHRWSLGRQSMLASQCITVALYLMHA